MALKVWLSRFSCLLLFISSIFNYAMLLLISESSTNFIILNNTLYTYIIPDFESLLNVEHPLFLAIFFAPMRMQLHLENWSIETASVKCIVDKMAQYYTECSEVHAFCFEKILKSAFFKVIPSIISSKLKANLACFQEMCFSQQVVMVHHNISNPMHHNWQCVFVKRNQQMTIQTKFL